MFIFCLSLLSKDSSLSLVHFQSSLQHCHRFIYDTETGLATCSCPTFWARFSDGRCYEEYTQGPCQLGDIVLMDRDTGVGFCGCNTTLPMYYHAETNQEQFTMTWSYISAECIANYIFLWSNNSQENQANKQGNEKIKILPLLVNQVHSMRSKITLCFFLVLIAT